MNNNTLQLVASATVALQSTSDMLVKQMQEIVRKTELLKQALHALGLNRVMAQDANGDYTKEVTPKIQVATIEAIEKELSL
jgi:hypothetical protein